MIYSQDDICSDDSIVEIMVRTYIVRHYFITCHNVMKDDQLENRKNDSYFSSNNQNLLKIIRR